MMNRLSTAGFVPPSVCIGFCLFVLLVPGHALHEKEFTETNRRRYTGQQPAKKDARGPGNKPQINCGSTGRFVPSTVNIGFLLFALAKKHSEQLFTVHWRSRGLARPPKCLHLVLPSIDPPRRQPCAVPNRTALFVFGFWTRQVLIMILFCFITVNLSHARHVWEFICMYPVNYGTENSAPTLLSAHNLVLNISRTCLA